MLEGGFLGAEAKEHPAQAARRGSVSRLTFEYTPVLLDRLFDFALVREDFSPGHHGRDIVGPLSGRLFDLLHRVDGHRPGLLPGNGRLLRDDVL